MFQIPITKYNSTRLYIYNNCITLNSTNILYNSTRIGIGWGGWNYMGACLRMICVCSESLLWH